MIKGVILDLDGTLIDSNDAHALSWVEALHECGIGAHLDRVRGLVGMGSDQLLPELGLFSENEKFEQVKAGKQEIFSARHLPGLKPFPGARALVERLQQRGLKLVVGSSSGREDLERLLRKAGLEDILRNTVSSDEAASSKPEPDILRAALEKIRLEPHEALLLGDTPYDIYAGKRAGVETIAFTCGGWREEQLRAAGALAVYQGPQELLESFRSSPLGLAGHGSAA